MAYYIIMFMIIIYGFTINSYKKRIILRISYSIKYKKYNFFYNLCIMVKKGLLENDFKKRKLYIKFCINKFKYIKELRILKKLYNFGVGFPSKIYYNNMILYKISNNSITKIKNRCWITGKARSFYKFFGLCRNFLKNFVGFQYIPGITKSSW
jgi:small subunit ribosomal protein S14